MTIAKYEDKFFTLVFLVNLELFIKRGNLLNVSAKLMAITEYISLVYCYYAWVYERVELKHPLMNYYISPVLYVQETCSLKLSTFSS